jgi:iron complex transport system ATP-binding protein
MGVMLEVENVACGYGEKEIVRGVSLVLEAGDILCLLGANGCGKTTLFKAILGLLPIRHGCVRFKKENLAGWPRRKLAHVFAYVPQAHTPPFTFTVLEVVMMGRSSHLQRFFSPGPADREIAEEALHCLSIAHLAKARYTEVSGGERQLVLIARALAQQAQILVMDEPASNLDFGNRIRVLSHIRKLAAGGRALLITTHSPNHVFECATRVAIMKDGRLMAQGSPQQILTKDFLEKVYGVPLQIIDVDGKHKACIPSSNPGP